MKSRDFFTRRWLVDVELSSVFLLLFHGKYVNYINRVIFVRSFYFTKNVQTFVNTRFFFYNIYQKNVLSTYQNYTNRVPSSYGNREMDTRTGRFVTSYFFNNIHSRNEIITFSVSPCSMFSEVDSWQEFLYDCKNILKERACSDYNFILYVCDKKQFLYNKKRKKNVVESALALDEYARVFFCKREKKISKKKKFV